MFIILFRSSKTYIFVFFFFFFFTCYGTLGMVSK